ncbi:RDD family protein [Streptomyces spinoverrucosus]|uniref:RDD family protein n=1 Tax=Streptomyces spinoverrucosus TaxID=284043 RepID=UPI0018C4255D|nr:RDD family protein [Streptomyces spinoverrucosus]MBG0854895.1 RDD family protein [Streptomyces spinoverrucosus]
MSAPTPAPGDDRPREGYYPDPSIPGYVRYWNGAAWVPGTSRPAPADGEPLAPPPGVRSAQPAVEETGPHFFDEDPEPVPQDPKDAQHGSRPEPASAWGADRSRQSGFGGDQDRRVSWPAAPGADPRVPADPPAQPDGDAARTDGTASIPPAESEAAASGNTFVFRRPTAKSQGAGAGTGGPDEAAEDPGTMTFRAVGPRRGQQEGTPGPAAAPQAGGSAASNPAASAGQGTPGWSTPAPSTPAQTPAGTSGSPGFGAGKAAAARAAAQSAPAAAPTPQSAGVPHQAQAQAPAPTPAAPVTSGSGGGQSSWAQQVHRLAGTSTPTPDEQPVAPWKPPVEDPFQAAARRQAAARPAGLGKRLAARLIDTLVIAGVTAVAAVPLGAQALDHIQGKIDEAKLSGQTVTVWLLDGTTSTYLAAVVAVLLLVGVVYEALPTAKWGRTLGKKLLGLEVRDIEGHEPPSFGAALRRWLVYSVPGLLCFGLIGVLWCVFDKPWRQCWHDKAAHTFVAG